VKIFEAFGQFVALHNSGRTPKTWLLKGKAMECSAPAQITEILVRWTGGDHHALDALTPLVYKDLRRMASYLLRSERPGHTLQPTALVNEAYLKLAGQANFHWQNRTHFFAVASRVMRQILVDSARSHLRAKRGGGAVVLSLDEELIFAPERSADLVALDHALDLLAEVDARKAKVVEMRFFGGLGTDEIAEVLQVSPNTVMRDWNMAKAWLRREIESDSKDETAIVAQS
jgi:RNA polymerase sigma-70 factor (ECF subfamily)